MANGLRMMLKSMAEILLDRRPGNEKLVFAAENGEPSLAGWLARGGGASREDEAAMMRLSVPGPRVGGDEEEGGDEAEAAG